MLIPIIPIHIVWILIGIVRLIDQSLRFLRDQVALSHIALSEMIYHP